MKKGNSGATILGTAFIILGMLWFMSNLRGGFGFGGFGVKGSGNLITETRDVSGFDSIELNSSADLVIIQDGTESLIITADDNVMEYVSSDVRRDELVLETKGVRVLRNANISYELHVDDLEKVQINGSADISAETLKTDSLNIEINGSGDVVVNNLDANELEIEISGSGDILMRGSADTQQIEINGSGEFDGSDLMGRAVEVDISGSGTAKVVAEQELDAEISGSGDVFYVGNPAIDVQSSGSGSVKQLGGR